MTWTIYLQCNMDTATKVAIAAAGIGIVFRYLNGRNDEQEAAVNVQDDIMRMQMSQREMNTFQAHSIQPTEEYHDGFKRALDMLIRYLHSENVPFDVSEVVKSGSLGKGTAVIGKADIDCVMYINDFRGMDNIQLKIKECIDNIWDILAAHKWNREGKLKLIRRDSYLINLKLRGRYDDEFHEVDLLPTYDILRRYPEADIYDEMRNIDGRSRGFYSAPLARLQLEFVKQQPTIVKSLIRTVKYWSKTRRSFQKGPPSYFYELLVIDTWERAGSPWRFDLRVGLRTVLKRLTDPGSIRIKWTVNYDRPCCVPQPGRPWIVDPANPFSDVGYNIDSDKCNQLVREADKGLCSPLLEDVEEWDI
ncbi:2'-5'-oligoadenylate synthase 1A-like isoform X1 [Tubulanus polymorphus]|uniref:2'-5'-oligoadenylate synthase 1A-like isoform X1 n=3 Tax=Tubulanus polymorphus TaxID=672921 RepID=UPI003DA3AD96